MNVESSMDGTVILFSSPLRDDRSHMLQVELRDIHNLSAVYRQRLSQLAVRKAISRSSTKSS